MSEAVGGVHGQVRSARPARLAPLSSAQRRLWFLHQWAPELPAGNLTVGWRLGGSLDLGALRYALRAVSGRHEIMRTRFVAEDGCPRLLVVSDFAPALQLVDLSNLNPTAADAEAAVLAAAEPARPFDLAAEPPLRAVLLRLAEDVHMLLVSTHQIVADESSLELLAHELGALYRSERGRHSPPADPPPRQYADVAAWQASKLAGAARQAALRYWRERLDGLAPLELPMARRRPGTTSGHLATERRRLRGSIDEALAAFLDVSGATVLEVLLAAFAVVLGHHAGRHRVAVGTSLPARPMPEAAQVIGPFANPVVLTVGLEGDPSFRELIARVREAVNGAQEHQYLPFGELLDALRCERDTSRHPLFQVALSVEAEPALELPELETAPVPVDRPASWLDLCLRAIRRPGSTELALEFATTLFERDTIRFLLDDIQAVLERALHDPTVPLGGMELAPAPGVENVHVAGHSARADRCGERQPPSTPREDVLAEIWQAVLDVPHEEFGVHDHFFVLGGSSVQAVQLQARIREIFQVNLDLATIFAEGTIHQLAKVIDREGAQREAELSEEELRRLLAELDGLSEEEAARLLRAGGLPSGEDPAQRRAGKGVGDGHD